MRTNTTADDSSNDATNDAANDGLKRPGLGNYYHVVEGIEVPVIELEFQLGDGHHADSFVISECPACWGDHRHDVIPEVVLGGMKEIEAQCGTRAPIDSYFVLLEDAGSSIPAETIKEAREELIDEQGALRDPLIPKGVDLRAIQDSTVPIDLE